MLQSAASVRRQTTAKGRRLRDKAVTIRCLRAEADYFTDKRSWLHKWLQSAASVRRQTDALDKTVQGLPLQSAASVRRQT